MCPSEKAQLPPRMSREQRWTSVVSLEFAVQLHQGLWAFGTSFHSYLSAAF